MLTTKILFLLLLLVCIAFYILYIWDFALILLAIIASLPVVMLILLFITKALTKTEFLLHDKTAPKNVSFPVQLCITNNSILPIGKAEAYIEYGNAFGDSVNTFELHMPIHPRNTQKMTFQLSSEFCGTVRITCSGVYIYDPLRLFRIKIGKEISAEISVMPEIHEITGNIHFVENVEDNNCLYSQHKPGDDPSEIFDLREYSPGDKLNRIHWKLSSKKDDFIVKDYSFPIDTSASLFLDLKAYDEQKDSIAVFSTMIEAFFSVSSFLIENERAHTIIYYCSKTGNFKRHLITNHEELSDSVREFITSASVSADCESPENYFLAEQNLNVSSFTCITSAIRPQVYRCIDDSIDSGIKNVIIVLKDNETGSNLADDRSGINTIPVVIGNISASIKDIEL